MTGGPARGRRVASLCWTVAGLVLTVAGVAVTTETALKRLLLASGRSLAVPTPSAWHGAVGAASAVVGYAILSAVGERGGPDAAADGGDAAPGATHARDE
ncbi:hypothetical protein HZS55_00665 [Halosimplex rubrum]|uniref:Uncharacterized protein n=1 Tax=Halosimplex rubrum TaxID=869889 RepID=A0A7D5P1J6_9EURY|nr:hypothetical protein [Halosimplex rubrum]QLH75904.1 hypothetical protein HZS55_00665 [Halosimplex rubrum]